jgi:hypothetical protein
LNEYKACESPDYITYVNNLPVPPQPIPFPHRFSCRERQNQRTLRERSSALLLRVGMPDTPLYRYHIAFQPVRIVSMPAAVSLELGAPWMRVTSRVDVGRSQSGRVCRFPLNSLQLTSLSADCKSLAMCLYVLPVPHRVASRSEPPTCTFRAASLRLPSTVVLHPVSRTVVSSNQRH